MSENPRPLWRAGLEITAGSVAAEEFHRNLSDLRKTYGDDPEDVAWAYTALTIKLFAYGIGVFAALQLPPEDVPAALAETRETLAHLDFDAERKHVKKNERRYYDRFALVAAPLFAELGEAIEAVFNCYVAGGYDPTTNPDDLIVEALAIAETDMEQARRLIVQAGAVALDCHPLWWRWPIEAEGPARSWLVAVSHMVEDYGILGPIEEARRDMECLEEEEAEEEENQEAVAEEEPAAELSPMDDLVEELIEQGEQPYTPEQLALCQARREEAIMALMELAGDEDLQREDAPGEGYAPIRAIQLLGELQAVEASPALIDIVADAASDAIIYSAAIHTLEQIGPPALEPVLTFMRYSWDVETKTALAEVVAEVGQPDEQAYQTLVEVWNDVLWEEGKCLLAPALARTGGEQAIPLLQEGLEATDLDDLLDYTEVAEALRELGVEAPPPPEYLSLPVPDMTSAIQTAVEGIGDPDQLQAFGEGIPEEWRSHPEGLAEVYAELARQRLNNLTATQAILLPPEVSTLLTADMLDAAEMLTFDAPTKGYPAWLCEAYDHLAEHAGPDLQCYLIGVLLALETYLNEDYDIADDPDRLLAAARELAPDDEEQQRLFGQAGALVLHGRSFWSRWPAETDDPLSGWLGGLMEFLRPLKRAGYIPLRTNLETDPAKLAETLTDAALVKDEPPPAVKELLDLLIAQGEGSLTPIQRRRFTHQRAVAVPYLIQMVQDKQYWYEEGPGEGWAAILAVRLLGELKAIQAVDVLVSVVADSEPSDIIHDAALFSLMVIGRPVFSAVQDLFRYGRKVETKIALAEVLGRVSRQNPETFDLLRPVWESAAWTQNRRVVALSFGDLRDRRAIPLLQAALKDPEADILDLEHVCWALRQLGVSASPPEGMSSELKTPGPANVRLLYDESGDSLRVKYNVWDEPLCPDCGKPLVLEEDGWSHPPEPSAPRPALRSEKRKRRIKRRR